MPILKQQLLFVVGTNQLLSSVQDAGVNVSAIQFFNFGAYATVGNGTQALAAGPQGQRGDDGTIPVSRWTSDIVEISFFYVPGFPSPRFPPTSYDVKGQKAVFVFVRRQSPYLSRGGVVSSRKGLC